MRRLRAADETRFLQRRFSEQFLSRSQLRGAERCQRQLLPQSFEIITAFIKVLEDCNDRTSNFVFLRSTCFRSDGKRIIDHVTSSSNECFASTNSITYKNLMIALSLSAMKFSFNISQSLRSGSFFSNWVTIVSAAFPPRCLEHASLREDRSNSESHNLVLPSVLEHALGYRVLHTEHRHRLGIRDASWVRAVDSVDKLHFQTVQVWSTVQINQT